MPQWQFKLFEYDIRDEYDTTETEKYIPGKDNKKFVVQMFGIDEHGKTASIFVRGFDPFFYVKVGNDWENSDMIEFVEDIKRKMGSYYSDSLIKVRLIKKQKLYGFDDKKLHTFVQLKFKNMYAFNKAKNLWYKDTNENGRFERKLRPEGILFKEVNTELYEAQIPPLLRLFHMREISPSGWIALKHGTYMRHKKQSTTCDYEFTINYKQILPIPEKETIVPYKILSVDIEASSSHGDFPLAKKNYIKLATNIIDYLIKYKTECSEELLEQLILSALDYDNIKDIDKIYLKKLISKEEIQILIKDLLLIQPAKLENHITLEENEEDDDDDEEQTENVVEEVGAKRKYRSSNYKNKDSYLLELINDTACMRNTKIIELTKSFGQHNVKKNDIWEGIFPEVKGDQVTFIGSSLRRDGEEKPYLKHCIVVNSCDPITNTVVESYKTEKEALLAWTAFVQRENPDIIIGYNIHGWDEKFMFERSQELNCMKQFSKLSRNINEECLKEVWQGPGRPKKITIEENNLFIASGQYDIKYFKMTGRLQIDFLHLFRRSEQLTSYKLDFVASHFISDNIKDISYDDDRNISTIMTKNLTGLENDDYIVIEEIGHTTDLYEDGKKFRIKNLTINSFEIDGKITPDKTKELKWCLGKDDVTPQDIFRLTNEGPEGRAIVGKYCLKDTTLIHDLMRKNDTLTSYTEMSNLCWVPMSFLVFRGQGIKLTSYVAQKCRQKNTLMPVIEKSLDDEGYEGATVLPPKCGLYLDNPIACVDYSSLYPSSIISENISHDSKVWTKEYDLDCNLLKEWGEKDQINGNYIYDNLEGREYVDITYDTFKWIRKTPKAAATKVKYGYKICRFIQPINKDKAIVPSILEELLAARKATKKQMKNEKDPFMANIYDARQLAIKITANSLYGQTGAKTSTFYDKDVAASTTATGRNLLMYGKEVIEENYGDSIQETKNHGKVKTNAEVIYGDTDSVFFTFNLTELDGTKIIGKKALEITIELAQEASKIAKKGLKEPHDLEYEKTFLPYCLLSKKRYVGLLYEFDIEKCKRKSMGIVLKRRDNAPIVKDIYGGVIDILMNEQLVHKAITYVKECLQNVVDEKYAKEKLIVTKSLRSTYKNPMQIAHNVLALRMGERDSGNKPGSGDRIPFIYIKNENKKALQGERIEHPTFIKDNNLKIDYGFYITNQIMKPLLQLFALVLEQMTEFKTARGRTLRSWKLDIEKLHEKWPDEEKFEKKYEEFRCKEVKKLLFDPYIKMVK
jgi:DNA polymerase elongation subunit (family B)